MRRAPTFVCGVPIDDVTLDEAVDEIFGLVERGRETGRTHQVATVNVDFLVNALADAQLMSLLQRADLAVPDGMPIVWGSKWVGTRLRERVAGADLVPALARGCAERSRSMYLFGAAAGVAEAAADLLRDRFPGLRVVGDGGPMFARPEDMDVAAIARIREHDPDILCVALGHPKQERWIDHYRAHIGAPVLIGVGGSLDFLTGVKRRAPMWMQRTGTEWLHRALQEPQRLAGRYARDLVRFGPRLLWETALLRDARADVGNLSTAERSGDLTVLTPSGRLRLDANELTWTEEEWAAPGPRNNLVIDLRYREVLERREISEIVGMAKRLAEGGAQLTLASVRPSVAQTLLHLRLYGFLPTASHPRHEAMLDHPFTQPDAVLTSVATDVTALEPVTHA